MNKYNYIFSLLELLGEGESDLAREYSEPKNFLNIRSFDYFSKPFAEKMKNDLFFLLFSTIFCYCSSPLSLQQPIFCH